MKKLPFLFLGLLTVSLSVLGQKTIPIRRPFSTTFSPAALASLLTSYTVGNQLKDVCGKTVILKGVNKMVIFDGTDPEGTISFPEIAKTGANCVRIVWGIRNPDLSNTDDTRLDRIITNARNNGLIPIVGLWDYMEEIDGGFSKLQQYVDYWKRPAMVALIRRHQNYLIVNIGDEAAGGDENNPTDLTTYANAYKDAIRQLRTARIRVPLMIDGMDRGKSLHCFAIKGVEILNADPRKNVIFDFHPYWPKTDTDGAEGGRFIANKFSQVQGLPIMIVMGEIAKYGAWAGASSPCSDAGIVDYQQFIQLAEAQGIGWLVWEWGPGNQWQVANDCPELDMTTDRTYNSILAIPPTDRRAWIKEVTIDAVYSIKKTSKKTPYIVSKFKNCR